MKRLLPLCALWLLSLITAQSSTVVWSDDFNAVGRTDYNPYSFTGASGNDYVFTVTGTNTHTTAVSGAVLNVTDAGGDYASLSVNRTRWTPFSMATGDTITFAADMRVSSFAVGSVTAAVPRLVINMGSTSVFTLGFGRGLANDGVPDDADLFFYSTLDGSPTTTPTGAAAIGLADGSGWANGFDFGQYDSGSAANNDSSGFFYRLEATFTQGDSTMNATLTQLDGSGNATGNSVSFTRTLTNPANFDTGVHSFYYTSGSASQTMVGLDNLSVTVNNVPEPSRALLIFMGALILRGRRSRR